MTASEGAVQPKRPTIHQVAHRAGVSHQTVSRFLRNNGGLKPTTVAKVQAAIDELNYRPNRIARSMRTRRTGRIAILLPTATRLLPLRLLGAASAAAHEAGYTVDLVGLEGEAGDRAARAQELIDSGEFEGVLALASLGAQPAPWSATPVVNVADYDDELRGLGALADGAACGEVVRYLSGLGHRNFLHLAGSHAFTSARNRRQTFTDTVRELGLRGTVIDCNWSGQAGYEAVMSLPQDTDITAIVAANDLMAMGAVRAGLSRGWRVPDDISVFGWDDEELARFGTPSLSTVAIDRERQGREAMCRLIASMRGTAPPPIDTTSLHTVILRESTGPAPQRTGRRV
jgi:LacI family transcriptional regulator, repressor for deo operon, udp, cdd, tsx, nupC, and nupG